MDYVKAVSPVDNLGVEKAPVQRVDNETASIVSSNQPPLNNENNVAEKQKPVFRSKTNENLQPTSRTNEDLNNSISILSEDKNETVKHQVNNLQIQVEDHFLNNNNSAAATIVSNTPLAFSTQIDFQLSAPVVTSVVDSNTNETFLSDIPNNRQIQVSESSHCNVEEPKQKLYVEKSSTVIQVIEQNHHTPFSIEQINNNENIVNSGSESDSGNSENNDYEFVDASEFDTITASIETSTASPPKNISTLNIVLTNLHAQKFALVASDTDLQDKNSISNKQSVLNESNTESAAHSINQPASTNKSQLPEYTQNAETGINYVSVIKNDEILTNTAEIETANTAIIINKDKIIADTVEKDETITEFSHVAVDEKPSVSTLSRKEKKSITKLKKIAHQRAKDRQKLRNSSRSSSEGISDSSDTSAAKNTTPDANTSEAVNYDKPQNIHRETATQEGKSLHDYKEPEAGANVTGQSANVNLVGAENVNNNEQLLKTSTTVQVAQNSSKTFTAPIKRPSKIPVSLQRSVSKNDQKSPEATASSKIPIKSTVQTQIPKLSTVKPARTKHDVVAQDNIRKQPSGEQQEFTNSASIVLQNVESLKQNVASSSWKSNDVADEMEHSVQTIKDINRQLMQQKPYLTKKNSVESTTSSKQLSYTKSLDNDSDSSVSDSNVEELLDPSTDEDSYEDIEEYEEVIESDTEEYNQFDEQNIKSVNELNINLSQINEKVRELTSTLNNTDEKRKVYVKRHSYIEETCESEDYISDDDEQSEDETSEAEENLQEEVESKTDLNIEIKQPTELELMQVSLL